ncbi:translation machinery-associated protein 16 [Dermacentor albipictus]|uniref:translation machinery-associated protein 16 n=1 Tax=Dermacentor albipictus TaxID=60249 RepID=UPI0031FDAB6E
MPKANQAEKKRRIQARTSRPVHPNSRKAQQIARKRIHHGKIATRKKQLAHRLKNKLEKLAWFRENMPTVEADRLSPVEFDALIEKYFRRFDGELEHVDSIERIRGTVTQFKGRLDAIKITLENEIRNYNSCGIEAPDLLSPDVFKLFMEWDGKCVEYLPKIDMRTISKAMLERLASK